ncbi:MAG: uridine kinase [Lachnospiraceae bacterium]|nr:uridine kinase [Lachnospiraceae bacterium]
MNKTVASISNIVDKLRDEKEYLLVAIDGRCASGKTSIALELKDIYGCNVIHMDHFFLREEQRTGERLNAVGENIDHERFLDEVLLPLRSGKSFSYRPYNCGLHQFDEPIFIEPKAINIIEGSYSCHDKLYEYYDMRIFLSVESDEQFRRIVRRNGVDKATVFKEKWIPMEEQYFSLLSIYDRCEYCFTTEQSGQVRINSLNPSI